MPKHKNDTPRFPRGVTVGPPQVSIEPIVKPPVSLEANFKPLVAKVEILSFVAKPLTVNVAPLTSPAKTLSCTAPVLSMVSRPLVSKEKPRS
jgi:hypothetical protein